MFPNLPWNLFIIKVVNRKKNVACGTLKKLSHLAERRESSILKRFVVNVKLLTLIRTFHVIYWTNNLKCSITLQEIILGYNKTSHRLFLIPSLLFFPKVVAIMIVLIEVLLHVWAHSKNATNENENIYYRSPLNSLTSQFCTLCREEIIEVQVNKMQEERSKKFHLNLNQVAANLKTCT